MRKFINIILLPTCITIFMLSGCDNKITENPSSGVKEEQKVIKAFCSPHTTFIVKGTEVFATGLANSDKCNAGFVPKKKGSYSERYSDTFVPVAENILQVGKRGLDCYLDNNKNLHIKGHDGSARIVNNVSLMTDGYEIAYVKENKLFRIVPDDLGKLHVDEEIEEIKGLPNEKIVDILLWNLKILVLYENGEIRDISPADNRKGYEILVREYQFTVKPVRFVDSFSEMGIGIIDENDDLYTLNPYESTTLEAKNVRTAYYGEASTYYVLNNGSLWGKGWNAKGQLGTGDTKRREEYVKIMDGVKSVTGGAQHVVVITEDNKVYGFGENEVGQLSGTEKKYIVPTELNYEVALEHDTKTK